MTHDPVDEASAGLGPDDEGDSISLLRRAQGGDREAYERLFVRYYPRVLTIVRARLGAKLRRSTESRDLAQDAMVQAIRSMEGFEQRGDARLIGWFAKIVENRIRDARRRAEVRSPELEAIADHVSSSIEAGRLRVDPESPDSKPLSHALRGERTEALVRALSALPEAQREIVLRRLLQEESWQEIAEALDFPSPDAARMAYGRARVELGKLYGSG